MTIEARFESYANDFEVVYINDDWRLLEQYFAPDASYVTKGYTTTRDDGLDAVLTALRRNVSAFDRRCDTRELITTDGPTVEGNRLYRGWECRFTLEGVPDLVIEGTESLTYSGDLIVLLEEEFAPEAQKSMKSWVDAYGAKLGLIS